MPEIDDAEEFDGPVDADPADVVEHLADRRKIMNPDDVVGFCMECKNEQSDQKMYKSVFAQEGVAPVCHYCGGVVVIVYREMVDEAFKRSLDASRGIGRG